MAGSETRSNYRPARLVRRDPEGWEATRPIFIDALWVCTRLKLKNANKASKYKDWEKVLFADVSEEDEQGLFEDFDPDKDYKLGRDS